MVVLPASAARPPLPGSPFLPDWVAFHAAARPDAPAVAAPGGRLTYAELQARVEALAASLAEAAVGPGTRVVLALPNTLATVVAGLAVLRLGGVTVEVNREWGPEVIADILARTGSRHAFGVGRDARVWGAIAASRPLERLWLVHPGAPPPPLLAALGRAPAVFIAEDGSADRVSGPLPPPAHARRPEDEALILYTSGSTGRPRGVVLSHRNVEANSRSIADYLRLGPDDRALLVLPLYYCYGRSVLQTHLLAGGSVFMDGRLAFPRVVLEALATEACTGFAGVPLTFEIIRRQVDLSTLSFPRLRYLTQAGGAMAAQTRAWTRQAFRPAQLYVMYGQTEATARLAYLPPDRAEEKDGAMGIAIPGVELRVVDDAGAEVAPDVPGHLIARGENVMLGYLGEPEATAEVLRDGWLWTGDLAFRDEEGFLFHQGRSKDILKIGGHRVSPIEIEHTLERHPDVAEAAVIGDPEPIMGEVPVAFVVARAGLAPPREAELRRFCREHLPAYKVPARISVLSSLPRNEAGKLLKAELRRLPRP